ncbi:MAG: 2-amino-4-hydroxy-6-hydroxymethyldihydropteridine diphosphokinase [Microbacteriaceae bacterium]|nr:2-amino-4-hydroxy-6-hydroxymethyldihydropteridine diphosphokinase [Microbacteriaceae bacterium]
MTRAVVAMGANLGDRSATIAAAMEQLGSTDGVTVVGVSSLLETVAIRPDGPDDSHPNYLNGVALADTTLSAPALLAVLHDIENDFGRTRTERWGDRTLDLDLIVFGDHVEDGNLVVPHPRAHERAFVLGPWLELDPDAAIPGRGFVRDLLAEVTS